MKLTLAALLPLVVAAASATAEGFFRPTRVSYEDLMSGDHVSTKSTLAEALSTTGMISVTDIPDFQSKQEVMASLHGCAVKSKATEAHTFPDGTRRLTLATHSVPGSGGVQTVDHKSDSNHCAAFDTASMSFRRTVATATQAFADRLAEAVSLEQPQGKGEPLLSTATNYPFHTIADVVKAGEHLEHFHSYQKLQESPEETIELHTDQGLFLAFTPGRLISQDDSTKTELTSGFFIETKDGSSVEVEFTDQDDLVFILGDGVNQYVNDRLSKKPLRAVPHTLLLAPHGEAFSRVWYGRMVLPPADALHPVHDVTFGDLRQRMINASLDTTHNQDEDTLGLGCSSTKVARELSETTCQGNEIYCWHRCMDATLQQVSSEICSSRNLELSCVNPRLQISDGVPHGDFYPSCADRAIAGVESPLPTLPEYPRVEEVCTPEEYAQFADSSGYDHFHELEGNATLMWSVEDGEVNGRIAYDGLFGWLAFGFAYPMGKKNGMHNSVRNCPGAETLGLPRLLFSVTHRIAALRLSPDYHHGIQWREF